VRPSFTEVIDLLPDVFLACMIASDTGKEFWRSNFYKDGQFPLEIGWDQFAHAFCKSVVTIVYFAFVQLIPFFFLFG
jgi:hypothetical protein